MREIEVLERIVAGRANKEIASDLHITVGQPPVVRHHARMRRLEAKVLDQDDTTGLMKSITPDRCPQELQEKGKRSMIFTKLYAVSTLLFWKYGTHLPYL